MEFSIYFTAKTYTQISISRINKKINFLYSFVLPADLELELSLKFSSVSGGTAAGNT